MSFDLISPEPFRFFFAITCAFACGILCRLVSLLLRQCMNGAPNGKGDTLNYALLDILFILVTICSVVVVATMGVVALS